MRDLVAQSFRQKIYQIRIKSLRHPKLRPINTYRTIFTSVINLKNALNGEFVLHGQYRFGRQDSPSALNRRIRILPPLRLDLAPFGDIGVVLVQRPGKGVTT